MIEASVPRRFLSNETGVRKPRAHSSGKAGLPISSARSPIEQAINEDATANQACLNWWVAFAGKFRQS
ncbi:hypothetical protein B2M20_16145 [Nitrobacter vulgaris]|uniref:Uncharacterized protein n=1 Tax=Nitrobacter vulgaris TaxID=29421 RepID=A0A1V4HUN3_NITVU|nr:hypothetical protein B2M20_16145 [Nitrobacter vulgaris]